MEILDAIKTQIKEHPWPWLAGVFLVGFMIGLSV